MIFASYRDPRSKAAFPPFFASPWRLAILYLILGVTWIFISDHFVMSFWTDPDQIGRVQVLKGALFILATAAFVGFIARTFNEPESKGVADLPRQVLETAREIYHLINRQEERKTLLDNVAGRLVKDPGIRSVWIAAVDRNGILRHFAAAGFEEDRAAVRQRVLEGTRPRGGVNSRGSFNGSSPAKGEPGRDWLSGEICIPLRYDGFCYGYLGATLSSGHATLSLMLGEIGEDLAHALYSQELQEPRESDRQALLAAKNEAEAAIRAKNEFLAIMSHELRTPLNPIIGFTTILLEDSGQIEEREHLEAILFASQRLLRLVDDILEYARLDQASVRPVMSVFRPLELCEAALESAERLDDRGLTFRLTAGCNGFPAPAGEQLLRADRNILNRILESLLSNAAKFTERGGVCLEIGLEEAPRGQKDVLHCAVVDSGPGIAPHYFASLFEPFSQADSSYSRAFEGVGLGLATCKKLIALTGGEIGVENLPDRGARFWFRMPARAIGRPQDPQEARALDAAMSLVRECRLLLAEDDPANAKMTSVLLERAGAEVVHASNGEEAIAYCQEDDFDLILMDIDMPVIDGIEATERVRALPEPKNRTPVIALSAHVLGAMHESARSSGMSDYLSKPVVPEELIQKINRFI